MSLIKTYIFACWILIFSFLNINSQYRISKNFETNSYFTSKIYKFEYSSRPSRIFVEEKNSCQRPLIFCASNSNPYLKELYLIQLNPYQRLNSDSLKVQFLTNSTLARAPPIHS